MSEDEARDKAMPMPDFQTSISNGDYSYLSPATPAKGKSRAISAYALGTPAVRPRSARTASGKECSVWPMSKDVRDCNDTVHKDLSILPALQVILDSPPVQRLANLNQLGCASNTYPCCTHKRKEHSLGVMELAGRMATLLKQKQEQLEISEKDVLCLRIAGLCHDLGHGPFSHAYETFLKAAYKNEKEHPEQYEERNRKFKEEHGVDMPPIPEKYEHENTSLMMVDFALSAVGLEIDWENLDEPLKQIGSGIDRELFGVPLRSGEVEPLTSRDMIFVKECICASPLNEDHAPTPQTAYVGRGEMKEFLFDVVNNRHNGLDVDKIDYFIRDEQMAYGSIQSNFGIWLRCAFVTWAECPNPKKCFICKDKVEPVKHLMICYPDKLLPSAMMFYATRIKNHSNVYTHKKTVSAELHTVDLLLEADKHSCMLLNTQANDPFSFPVPSTFDSFKYQRLPISRAWMYPRLFLRMDDTIISIIENKVIENPLPRLDRLRRYLNDHRCHRFYKCVAEIEIGLEGAHDKLWEKSEDDIKAELIDMDERYTVNGELVYLYPEDVIVEKRTLHYGRKEKNPVSQVRFLSKSKQQLLSEPIDKLPEAEQIENLPNNTPREFLRKTLRFFCRNNDKYEFVCHVFQQWKFQRENPGCTYKNFSDNDNDDDDDDTSQPDSQPITQDDDVELILSPRKRKESDGGESSTQAKQRLRF